MKWVNGFAALTIYIWLMGWAYGAVVAMRWTG